MTIQQQTKVIDHTHFLIDGKLEAWTGAKAQVWSPITDDEANVFCWVQRQTCRVKKE